MSDQLLDFKVPEDARRDVVADEKYRIVHASYLAAIGLASYGWMALAHRLVRAAARLVRSERSARQARLSGRGRSTRSAMARRFRYLRNALIFPDAIRTFAYMIAIYRWGGIHARWAVLKFMSCGRSR